MLLQDKSEQRPHKVSCQIDHKDAPHILETLSSRLKDLGVYIHLIIYSLNNPVVCYP